MRKYAAWHKSERSFETEGEVEQWISEQDDPQSYRVVATDDSFDTNCIGEEGAMIINYNIVFSRELIAQIVSHCMGDILTGFKPYKPNEQDSTFWTVDRANNWKIKFSSEHPTQMEIVHRYNNLTAIRALATWVAYQIDGTVEAPEGITPKTTGFKVMREGGKWLGATRDYLECHAVRGDQIVWNSTAMVGGLCVRDVEEMVADAVAADRNSH